MRQRLARHPHEFTVRTIAARVACELVHAGVTLTPGEKLRFLLVPGPEKARAWELLQNEVPYDREAYTELLLRAVESVLAPVGVDRQMLTTWLLGNAGYWGPPGTLPPPGMDGGQPLLAGCRMRRTRWPQLCTERDDLPLAMLYDESVPSMEQFPAAEPLLLPAPSPLQPHDHASVRP
jgi:hypothetical protein